MTKSNSPATKVTWVGEARWKRGRWVWAVWAVLPTLALLPLAIMSRDMTVFGESGVIEFQQAGLLLLAALVSLVVAGRLNDRQCRNSTLLLGVLAALALGREQDLHVLLNPEYLGEWGLRFRMDWWFNAEVPFSYKAPWIAAIGVAAAVMCTLAWRSRGPIDWRFARPRLMALTGVMYATGFVCDDLLRNVVELAITQTIEESAELVGAAALLGATLGPESAAVEFLAGDIRDLG